MAGTAPRGRRARAAAVASVIALALAAAPAASGQVLLDRVLAVVSGTVITLSDARAALDLGFVDASGARDPIAVALTWLIERQLVLDEALRYEAASLDLATVEAAVLAVRLRFPSDQAWSRTLARLGLTEESARALIGDLVFAQAYAESRFAAQFAPSDDELRAAWERERDRFTREGKVLTFEDARAEVEAVVMRERRQQGIAEWIARLRRRADVSELYVPVR